MTLPDPGDIDIKSLLRETPVDTRSDLLRLKNNNEVMEYIKRRGGYVELPPNREELSAIVKCPCLVRDGFCGIRDVTDTEGRTRRVCTKPLWIKKNWKKRLWERPGETDYCPYAPDRPGLEL